MMFPSGGGKAPLLPLIALKCLLLILLLNSGQARHVAEQEGEEVQQANDEEQNLNNIVWWKKTNFYHIYLRSFKDSNGDGQGDLRGVIEKLDYLQHIGVETLLMAPFYSSPMKDGGYDIDDYLEINPMFGTMKDFEDLVAELRLRSMRIVVDFVPNHSSNKHAWFECSERALVEPQRCGRYKDYYIWSNSTRFEGKLPSNWISVFGGGPAWQWSELRKEFYLHQFLPEQPDLNFRNPEVREEFKSIARFWLQKGADGLRVDSAIYLIEDDQFLDEPPNEQWRSNLDDPCERLRHIYTRALHESAEIVKDWRQVADEFLGSKDEKVIITEAYDAIPKLIEYYGMGHEDRYADLPFNFQLLNLNQQNLAPKQIQLEALNWIRPVRELNWPREAGAMSPWICWVTGNHDNQRLANKVGTHMVPIMKWLTYLLPGVPINYYGDELPLRDANFNTIPERTILEGEPTRLPFRVPMAWTSEAPNGGFSSAEADIWLPLNENYQSINVESLLAKHGGFRVRNQLQLFVELERLRRDKLASLVFGDLVFYRQLPYESDIVFAMARVHPKFGSLLMLVNFDPHQLASVRLASSQSELERRLLDPPKEGRVRLINYVLANQQPETSTNQTNRPIREGDKVQLDGLVLGPSQALVIEF